MMRGYGYGLGTGGFSPAGHAFGFGTGLIGWLLVLLMIAAIVVLVVMLVRKRPAIAGAPLGPANAEAARDEALAIAVRRYANGEISKEQYLEIRDTLAPPPAEVPAQDLS